MTRWVRALALAVIAPVMLAGCLFMPGKFESVMTIHADRSFAFSYKGEVTAVDLEGMIGNMFKGFAALAAQPEAKEEDGAAGEPEAAPDPDGPSAAEKAAEADAKFRDLAEQLSKEAGYNKVEYRGNGTFYVDYSITGTLTHNYVFPYNLDAAMVVPWIAIEMRGKDAVRLRAPGFAEQDDSSFGAMGADSIERKTEGRFTLITDAEIVSQNNEAGGTKANGTTTIVWQITPQTKLEPTAVLRVKPM